MAWGNSIIYSLTWSCCWNNDDRQFALFPDEEDTEWADSQEIWDLVASRRIDDPTHGANHYFADHLKIAAVAKAWKRTVEQLLAAETAHIGHHRFFKL